MASSYVTKTRSPKIMNTSKTVSVRHTLALRMMQKCGFLPLWGGGRSSAKETAARVAAAAIAKQLLLHFGIDVKAYVSKVGKIEIGKTYSELDLSKTEENIVRCPDAETAEKMIELIKEVKKDGDTMGGLVSCVITGVPAGLGVNRYSISCMPVWERPC